MWNANAKTNYWFFDTQYSLDRENEICESIDERSKHSDWLYCATCRNKITHITESVNQLGNQSHTFTNPHGYSFHIGCFRYAPGCSANGEETDEYSWFPGHTWRIALCGRCTSHLGWKFYNPGNEFYGLILNQLSPDTKNL